MQQRPKTKTQNQNNYEKQKQKSPIIFVWHWRIVGRYKVAIIVVVAVFCKFLPKFAIAHT